MGTEPEKTRGIVWGLILAAWLFQGCAATQLSESWEDESFKARPFKKILVLGVFTPDTRRTLFEDALVLALGSGGAVAGHTLMPDPGDYDEREEIRAAVEKTAADGVIVATLKGVDKQDRLIPPRVEYVPAMNDRYGLYDYYGAAYEPEYHQAYTETDTIVRLDIALFASATGKMVWTGHTSSLNPSSGETVAREASAVIVREMRKKGLL